jgi:hypothetical protein
VRRCVAVGRAMPFRVLDPSDVNDQVSYRDLFGGLDAASVLTTLRFGSVERLRTVGLSGSSGSMQSAGLFGRLDVLRTLSFWAAAVRRTVGRRGLSNMRNVMTSVIAAGVGGGLR